MSVPPFAIFLLLAAEMIGATSTESVTSATVTPSPSGAEAQFKTCYANWNQHELILGNSLFERRWSIRNGLLTPKSFRNLKTGTEWIREPANTVTPHQKSDSLKITSRVGRFSVTGDEGLEVVITASGGEPKTETRQRFRLYPEVGGVETVLERTTDAVSSAQLSSSQAKNEVAPVNGLEIEGHGDQQPMDEVLEDLMLRNRHLRLIQVSFRDQTDSNNALVQENQWMLLNETDLRLAGNLFVLEDPLNGEGLVFLKLAPLPHARAVQIQDDCRINAKKGHLCFTGGGYPFLLLSYSGGSTGRSMALQDFQRRIRRYEPDRDGMFLSNTWGDRSRDARVTEEFVLKEIEAGAGMGVDVVQIDDGWQKGLSGNSAFTTNGAWGSFWDAGNDFWDPNPKRFPHGLPPLVKAAADHGMKLGLWYGPDSSRYGSYWSRDAERVLHLHDQDNINYFKFDSWKIGNPVAESNFNHLIDRLLTESAGKITIDLDVTAGTRAGYFGRSDCGPIFVENRYTDYPNYWPHLTLRNLWMLSRYVDPLRLRMEFLNNTRNVEKYGGDPLAPGQYSPDTLFATVMFCNPLGWFEVSNLPEQFRSSVAALVAIWKKERAQLFSGRMLPIGDPPDGQSWTGFASVPRESGPGYLLIFRELNPNHEWSMDLNLFTGSGRHVTKLAGDGDASVSGEKLSIRIPTTLKYIFLRVD